MLVNDKLADRAMLAALDNCRARVKTHLTLKQPSDQLRQMAFVDGLARQECRADTGLRGVSRLRRP